MMQDRGQVAASDHDGVGIASRWPETGVVVDRLGGAVGRMGVGTWSRRRRAGGGGPSGGCGGRSGTADGLSVVLVVLVEVAIEVVLQVPVGCHRSPRARAPRDGRQDQRRALVVVIEQRSTRTNRRIVGHPVTSSVTSGTPQL
jgi:hypothetical protein